MPLTELDEGREHVSKLRQELGQEGPHHAWRRRRSNLHCNSPHKGIQRWRVPLLERHQIRGQKDHTSE